MMTEGRTKKLINAPDDIIPEAIEGMLAAHPDILSVEGGTGRAVVAVDGPREGKVGIVIGGGSGHEPAFVGYVGRGLADAAAVGNVFASPGPEQIMDAARAADGGAGVMFLYGNYTGDVLNFDMAAEECADAGIPVRSIAVNDDVASAPLDRAGERRRTIFQELARSLRALMCQISTLSRIIAVLKPLKPIWRQARFNSDLRLDTTISYPSKVNSDFTIWSSVTTKSTAIMCWSFMSWRR
jgi:dihydroxyacetone kinase